MVSDKYVLHENNSFFIVDDVGVFLLIWVGNKIVHYYKRRDLDNSL